jgi:hypothetical protein
MSTLTDAPAAFVDAYAFATMRAIKGEDRAAQLLAGRSATVLSRMVALGVALCAAKPQTSRKAISAEFGRLIPTSKGGAGGSATHAAYKGRVLAALDEAGVMPGIWRDIPSGLAADEFAAAVDARAVIIGDRVSAMKTEAEAARAAEKAEAIRLASIKEDADREERVRAAENPDLIQGADGDTDESIIRAALASALAALATLRSFADHAEAVAALSRVQQSFFDEAAADMDITILAA